MLLTPDTVRTGVQSADACGGPLNRPLTIIACGMAAATFDDYLTTYSS